MSASLSPSGFLSCLIWANNVLVHFCFRFCSISLSALDTDHCIFAASTVPGDLLPIGTGYRRVCPGRSGHRGGWEEEEEVVATRLIWTRWCWTTPRRPGPNKTRTTRSESREGWERAFRPGVSGGLQPHFWLWFQVGSVCSGEYCPIVWWSQYTKGLDCAVCVLFRIIWLFICVSCVWYAYLAKYSGSLSGMKRAIVIIFLSYFCSCFQCINDFPD
jgi:hypothetical protein